MNRKTWTLPRVGTTVAIVSLVVAVIATAAWALRPVSHLAIGAHQTRFVVQCDFDKFRQIMVRKNATAAIVGRSGMELIDVKIRDLQVDASADDRPLLNAIRGKSKMNLDAIRQIRVRLDDPAIDADELALRQQAAIEADSMNVVTKSIAAAGNLESYETTLGARPSDDGTEVQLTVEMKVRVDVPKLFTSRADARVQQAAEDAINEQARSIEMFIAEHADGCIPI
ncbi:hypothetical protein Enr13x_49480 [Stieleria neptunia]|uniref:Uncharacterized protein n=1 Tax=Stieleria neptunia TaxID=2527979 RepID=A0A518HW52_9BACT|nr:hypothetical protein [Stieleria neptunia]QDV45075.1 hypothetical protein Enr13x_49480 [Stieleria neptunia]